MGKDMDDVKVMAVETAECSEETPSTVASLESTPFTLSIPSAGAAAESAGKSVQKKKGKKNRKKKNIKSPLKKKRKNKESAKIETCADDEKESLSMQAEVAREVTKMLNAVKAATSTTTTTTTVVT